MAYGFKTGGRTLGTPNKPKPSQKIVHGFISEFVDEYFTSGQFEEDFNSLSDPREKISVVEKLVNYIIPKQNSSKVDLTARSEAERSFAESLVALAEDNQTNKKD